jgi:hypothetical protein
MNNTMLRLHFFFVLLAVDIVLIGHWGVVAQTPLLPNNNATTTSTTATNRSNSVSSNNVNNDTEPPETKKNENNEEEEALCFTNFRDLMAAVALKPPFEFQTFIVCPNTIINVGDETFFGSNIYINGDDAMISLRQYTKIYCGDTGASHNNCTVRGGTGSHVYVRSSGASDADDKKRRMVISGFTFEYTGRAAISVVYPGADLTMIDCIFRYCHNGILTATAPPPSEDDDGIMEMTVTFRNCTFRDNKVTTIHDNNSGNNHYGRWLFDVQDGGVHLTIQESVLVNNTFSFASSSASSSSSDTYSQPLLMDAPTDRTVLTLLNNCFYDHVNGATALIRVYSIASLRNVSHNHHGPPHDDKDNGPSSRQPPQPPPVRHCSFIQVQQKPPRDFHAVSTTTTAGAAGDAPPTYNNWCVDFDLDECPLVHGNVVAAAATTTDDESPPFSSSSSTRPWSSAISLAVAGLAVVAMMTQHRPWWWDPLLVL